MTARRLTEMLRLLLRDAGLRHAGHVVATGHAEQVVRQRLGSSAVARHLGREGGQQRVGCHAWGGAPRLARLLLRRLHQALQLLLLLLLLLLLGLQLARPLQLLQQIGAQLVARLPQEKHPLSDCGPTL